MQIFVNKITGETVTVNVNPSDTVESVYWKINNYGVNAELHNQRLIYAGKILNNDHTLSDYNIKPGSTIFHSLALRGGAITLMVQLVGTGTRNITVIVEFTDTIANVKKKIHAKMPDVPVGNQYLVFGTEQLNNNKKVNDYPLQNGSTIHLMNRLPGG